MASKTDSVLSATLFSGLDNSQLNQIRDIAVRRNIDRGEIIFLEGDPGNGFFMVMDGRVKIFKLSPEGKEKILNIFGTGETFGEIPVFMNSSFPANAQAISKCRILFFPKDDFLDLLSRNPSLSLNMLAVLSSRLHVFASQIEQLAMKDVSSRLATYLLYLADESRSDHDTVRLPISKRHLSSLLGTIPETLSRIFARMSEMNLIQTDGSIVRILDRDRLAELAERGKTIAL